MSKNKLRTATALYVLGIFLAGAANALSRLAIRYFMEVPGLPATLPALSTLLFCVNLAIYLFLIVFWKQSVRFRLLPSHVRDYMIAVAWCAFGMLLLRSVKYRLIDDASPVALRYMWYLYYVPLILLPTLFLIICIRIGRRNSKSRFNELLLLIPAGALIALFLTNDLHHFAFRPNGESIITGANDSYRNNFLLYVYYAYWAVTVIIGLIMLIRANSPSKSVRKVLLPFVFLPSILILALMDKTLNWIRLPSMFAVPEIVSFGMISILEGCMRNRLIPYNEQYGGFFARMRFPAVITQSDLTVVYRSAQALEASEDRLRESLDAPVYLDSDTKLTGKPVTAGYTFYTEDETELHRMNDALAEANELLASENDLIQAENELRAREAAVDSRNIVYARVAEAMLPYHRRALDMLDGMSPDDPDYQEKVARLNLLNAYIKRGANLLLVSEGEENIPLSELRLALEELARYLRYCGVQANVSADGSGAIDRRSALDMLTALYELTELILDCVTMMHIVLTDGEMRVTADCAREPETPEGVAAVENDGLWFFSIPAEEGGAL